MRRRRTIAIVGLLVALIAGGLVWWKLRPDPRPAAPATTAADDPWASEDSTSLIAKKRAARGDAAVDTRLASLAGHVRRASDGAGVAGAVVTVNPRQFGGSIFPSGSEDDAIVAITDAAGAWAAPAVRPGAHVVSAAAMDLLPASVEVEVDAGVAKTGIELSLEAGGATVSGTVSDIGGGPIADARVTVIPAGIEALHSAKAYVAITGADGGYRLTLPDASWHATAGHADYTDDDGSFVVRGRPVTVDFTLTPGGTIRGQVIARDTGKPVAAAQVTAAGGHGGRGDDFGGRGGATTDAAGNFTLRGVGSGALTLRASGRGYASAEPTVVELGIGEEVAGVTVTVDRAYTVSGFVVRKGTSGEGVAGVRVGVFSVGEETAAFALQPSAADGYFEILGVRPASYMIAALGEGVMPEIGKPVAVVDHDLTDVLVTMDAGATLSGRVNPAAVARLSLEIDPSKIGIGNMFDVAKAAMVNGTSDATGGFTLRSVPPGTFTIVAHTRDGRSGKLTVTVAAADQTGLLVPLEARGSVSGRVVDASGTAVAGVTVEASGSSGGMSFGTMDQGLNQSVTAPDGGFRVAGLEPGAISLSVSDQHGPLAWADRDQPARTVTITGAEEVRDVTLTIEARDGVIRGVVIGLDRRPVADAWVSARSMESPWAARMEQMRAERAAHAPGADADAGTATTTEVSVTIGDGGDDDEDDRGPGRSFGAGKTVLTGADGRFTVDGLRRGAYHVTAEATKGGERAQKSGVKTGATVTLTLEPLGALTVVVTAGGRPVPSYDLSCDGPADSYRRKVAAVDGSTVIERLPAGTYRCVASADAGSARGTIPLDGRGRLELALTGWASVTGVVVDEAGQPRAGLRVVAHGEGGDMGDAMTEIMTGGGITTDATGRFEVGRLAAGTGQLMIFDADAGFTPLVTQELTLVAGQRLDVGTLTAKPAPGE